MSYVLEVLAVVEGGNYNYKTLDDVFKSFAPYHTLDAFHQGYKDYKANKHVNPHSDDPKAGLKAQAWDRGHMAGSEAKRHGLMEVKYFHRVPKLADSPKSTSLDYVHNSLRQRRKKRPMAMLVNPNGEFLK